MFSFIVVLACGLFALYYAYDTSKRVFSAGTGTEEMQKIAGAIQEGAQAYLNRQYKTIAIVGVIVAVLLAWALSGLVALGFVLGAVLSGVAGYIGMNVSVRANIRTTEAARQGMTPALNVAFQAGAVTGLLVVGLGLLGVVLYYGLLTMFGVEQKTMLEALVALSFGASLISISAAASSRRAPTWAPTSWARSKPASPKTTRATPPSSPTTWATTWATAPVWPPTSLKPTP